MKIVLSQVRCGVTVLDESAPAAGLEPIPPAIGFETVSVIPTEVPIDCDHVLFRSKAAGSGQPKC